MLDYESTTTKDLKRTTRLCSPNNLPFLQSQVLERIYVDIDNGHQTTIEELSSLTDYPASSKILLGAINSLLGKRFLLGSIEQPFSFSIPEERLSFFRRVIERSDYSYKHYSVKLLDNLANKPTQLMLPLQKPSISELNRLGIVHRWYTYLEDFPYWLIEQKIKDYNVGQNSLVVDPFCGSGTTLVAANMFHIDAIGFDTNPLMAFVSQIKTQWDIDIDEIRSNIIYITREFLRRVRDLPNIEFYDDLVSRMPKKEINQWLSPILQREVSLLKNIISSVEDVRIRGLLLFAMSKSCFDASYAALCPGTTFYPFREKKEFWDLFSDKVFQIYDDLKVIQSYDGFGKSRIINDTCLNARQYLEANTVDFIITSPPYPNDLEYTRQTRLELYLLDFVKNMKDVKALKKKMVKASTKLIFDDSDSARHVEKFESIQMVADEVKGALIGKNWGWDYPRMIKEYFGDMYLCIREFYPLLANSSHFLLVVGNQTSKGIMIPVGDILIDLAQSIGYKNCRKELFRMRRSTTHRRLLPEEIVILEK